MRLSPHNVMQIETVDFQSGRRGEPPIERRRMHRQDLGFHKCPFGAEGRGQLDHLILHALVFGVPRILVCLQARVERKPAECLVLRGLNVQRFLQA